MIACVPPPPSTAYQLVDELREPRAVAGVHLLELDDLQSEQALLTKLGARGWGRIHHFRNHYNAPWGEHGAMPLSPRALESLVKFVRAAPFPHGKTPSVFLTDRGGLELCWENDRGEARQVEFMADGVEYYVAEAGEEGSITHDAVIVLAEKLMA